MSPRVEQVFKEAIALAPADRPRFIEQACESEPQILDEVQSLVAHHEQHSAFLEVPAIHASRDLPSAGMRIGRYRLQAILGQGGMGVVYRAEQQNPKRCVALKVVRHGFGSREARRRFELEAEVLGRLKHPCVAQVYEAGMFKDPAGSLPYFAMELVDGHSLDEYVLCSQLTIPDILRLLIRVCDGVQHAHQKGVVHRDLKPSNIVVTDDGQPKILDFGVARVTDSDIQTTTQHTTVGQLVGTLPYMSPEQCDPDALGIDTRSDVYALGVITYQLLGGRLPIDVAGKRLHEAVQLIRSQDPPPLGSLKRDLRGDVETIVSKALEKDRGRRYQSASDFASDLRRFLINQPIVARPDSLLYNARKFAGRHRGLVWGLASAMVLLIVGSIGTGVGFINAQRQATRARATSDFFQSILAAPSVEKHGRAVQMVEVLDWASAQVDEQLPGQPEVMSAVLDTLGTTYHSLGLQDKAEAHLARALALRKDHLGQHHLETLATTRHYAAVIAEQRSADAETFAREALRVHEQVLGPHDPHTLEAMDQLGWILRARSNLHEAQDVLVATLDARRKHLGPRHEDTLVSINNLAWLYEGLGNLDESLALYRESWDLRSESLGSTHPDTLTSMNSHAWILMRDGQLDLAESQLQQVLAIRRDILGDDHPETLLTRIGLATILNKREQGVEAETQTAALYDDIVASLGEDHEYARICQNVLVEAIRLQGDDARLEQVLTQLVAKSSETHGQTHKRTLSFQHQLARALRRQERLLEAGQLFCEVFESRQTSLGPENTETLQALFECARVTAQRGEFEAAEPLSKDLYYRRQALLGDDARATAVAKYTWAEVLIELERYDQAGQLLADVPNWYPQTEQRPSRGALFCLTLYGRLLSGVGECLEADRLLRDCHAWSSELLGVDHPRTNRIQRDIDKNQARMANGGCVATETASDSLSHRDSDKSSVE